MISICSSQVQKLVGTNRGGVSEGHQLRRLQKNLSLNSFSRRQQLLFLGGSLVVVVLFYWLYWSSEPPSGASTIVVQGVQAEAAGCDDLISTSSGIKYCEIKEGSGNLPVKSTIIRAHYEGKLESGKVFDSSYPRGRPLTFTVGVGQVIKGWDMGILGSDDLPPMKAGGKRRLVIPSELAYGERGAGGGLIPPNATLIFDVEYLGKQSD
eukprot:TRINITY_DN771_c0_g1_i3.p1 TRINITY_DN771_c0_g1~~TRINITY_DN771_c0_g1_i3.p1  ORF type:complete len:209 (+),score=31.59 TRINITY_DN771_c0_g1_i3:56-682(+)